MWSTRVVLMISDVLRLVQKDVLCRHLVRRLGESTENYLSDLFLTME